MATNNIFYRETKDFVIKSLKVLEEIKNREGIPLGPKEEEIAISENNASFRFVQKPAYSYFISNNWEKIKELPEYEECKKCMYEDKTINKHLGKLVGTAGYGMCIDIDTCLQRLILGIILESESLKFNEKILQT
ncbi:hypothetical protein DRN85_07255 [Methanosarcinales archaeon]|nr:MAG: hypothetical protein DRN85_07255 [Methanosarcinales archaeon]